MICVLNTKKWEVNIWWKQNENIASCWFCVIMTSFGKKDKQENVWAPAFLTWSAFWTQNDERRTLDISKTKASHCRSNMIRNAMSAMRWVPITNDYICPMALQMLRRNGLDKRAGSERALHASWQLVVKDDPLLDNDGRQTISLRRF